MSKPVKYDLPTIPKDSATSQVSGLEATYRAHYVYAASQRMAAAIAAGKSPEDAMRRERVYFDQHINAAQNRNKSAVQVDQAARKYGDQLGWYAKMDSITSAECREANGRNFSVSVQPPIGYPGAVHPHCRCRAGKAHATSKTVYTVKPEKKVA